MNEGIGSTTILTVIVVFIVFATAYMAYNVNYTKAFRLKNKVIEVYEQYDGICNSSNGCEAEIKAYADSIGYKPYSTNLGCCDTDILPDDVALSSCNSAGRFNLYCEYKIPLAKGYGSSAQVWQDRKEKYYYRVITRIDIRIPIIENVLRLRALTVSGDTKAFEEA